MEQGSGPLFKSDNLISTASSATDNGRSHSSICNFAPIFFRWNTSLRCKTLVNVAYLQILSKIVCVWVLGFFVCLFCFVLDFLLLLLLLHQGYIFGKDTDQSWAKDSSLQKYRSSFRQNCHLLTYICSSHPFRVCWNGSAQSSYPLWGISAAFFK